MACDPLATRTASLEDGRATASAALRGGEGRWAPAGQGGGSAVGGQPAPPWGPQGRTVGTRRAAERSVQCRGDRGRAAAGARATARPGRGAGLYPTWVRTRGTPRGSGTEEPHSQTPGQGFGQLETPPAAGRTSRPAGEGARPRPARSEGGRAPPLPPPPPLSPPQEPLVEEEEEEVDVDSGLVEEFHDSDALVLQLQEVLGGGRAQDAGSEGPSRWPSHPVAPASGGPCGPS